MALRNTASHHIPSRRTSFYGNESHYVNATRAVGMLRCSRYCFQLRCNLHSHIYTLVAQGFTLHTQAFAFLRFIFMVTPPVGHAFLYYMVLVVLRGPTPTSMCQHRVDLLGVNPPPPRHFRVC